MDETLATKERPFNDSFLQNKNGSEKNKRKSDNTISPSKRKSEKKEVKR